MLRVAFKEWSSVCRAVAEGRQALILRKGGVAEAGGVFRPEHDRFWLYPTYFHRPEAERPPAGVVRLSHYVDATDVAFVDSLDQALNLNGLHVWDEDVVRQRFAYRSPGLYVLTVRAFACGPYQVPERPEYAGCKTWVELADAWPTDGATPVLDDASFAALWTEIGRRLA